MTGAANRSVVLDNPTPRISITAPAAGTTASDRVPVTFTRTPNDDGWSWFSLFVDGNFLAQTYGDTPFEPQWLTPGQHRLRIEGSTHLRDRPVVGGHRDRPDADDDDHRPGGRHDAHGRRST